jgi:hypothetical protein
MANPVPMPTARQNAFRRLLGVFRAELSPEGARAYVEALKDYPDDRLIAGVERAIKECPTFPSAAVLRDHCRQAQPVVETVKLLPGRVDEDENDPTRWHRCWECQDSGWVTFTAPHLLKPEWEITYAKRCACAMTNPAVLAMSGAGAR